MKKWLVLLVLWTLALAAASLHLLSQGSVARPLAAGKLLVVPLAQVMDELPSGDPIAALLGERALGFRDLLERLDGAAIDPDVKAVLLEVDRDSMGWAKVEELRAHVAKLRAANRRVYLYATGLGDVAYYLSTSCDKLLVAPTGWVGLDGLMAQVFFLRGALDKLGIVPEFEHTGAYKNAPDSYTRSGMSAEQRLVLGTILDQRYEELVAAVAKQRKLAPEAVRAAIDQGPYTARRAHELGLVDGLLYEDQARDLIDRDAGRTLAEVDLVDYQGPWAPTLIARKQVALIYAVGTITSGRSRVDPFDGPQVGAETLIQALKTAREDKAIRGVLLRIDSPGGDALASDLIWREVALTVKEKPVVVSMSEVAASGGYYIASAASEIVAQPATLTGSIGAFAGHFGLDGLYQKLGVNVETVKRGRYADFLETSHVMSGEERDKLAALLWEFYHDDFVAKVAEGRKLDPAAVDAAGRGRVWTGAEAKPLHLVDRLGGFDEAMAALSDRAGVSGQGIEVVVLPRPGFKSLRELLTRRPWSTGSLELEALARARSLARPAVYALMPFRLEFH